MQKLLITVVLVGMANFMIFWFNAMTQGGDALNGKISDGHYYLGSHGYFTEVSKKHYEFNRIHTFSVCISWPFVMVCGYLYQKRQRRLKIKPTAE